MSRKMMCGLLVVGLMAGMAQAALVHQYTFEDGTAKDSVGTAHGAAMNGALIAGGRAIFDGVNDFVDLPGPAIAINTYPALTLELWSTQTTPDQGFTMTASLGGTWGNGFGKSYVNIATSRGDQVNRGAIANTPDQDAPWADEVGVNGGAELNDGKQHQYVVTVTPTFISYYVDGALKGSAAMGATTIGGLSNDFAYLGKGVYTVDVTWRGMINEFNMYNTALTLAEVQAKYAAGPIPEPMTLAILGLGGLALLRRRK